MIHHFFPLYQLTHPARFPRTGIVFACARRNERKKHIKQADPGLNDHGFSNNFRKGWFRVHVKRYFQIVFVSKFSSDKLLRSFSKTSTYI